MCDVPSAWLVLSPDARRDGRNPTSTSGLGEKPPSALRSGVLTRLEVDGFKNLLGVTIDLGPYTCIAGPNGAGKSNVFDVIEFLSLLADHSFMEAAQLLRSAGPRGGDPRALFWNDGDTQRPVMRICAEMIVPASAEDDFGRSVEPTTSFLRYELELAYEPPAADVVSRLGGVVLVSETLRHITLRDAATHLPWPHSKAHFRDTVVFGRRSGTAYISTTGPEDDGQSPTINVHQDGGSRGQPRTSPAARAPRTVIGTTTSSDDPTILVARREMQQWRMLSLEPSAMRSPDSLQDTSQIASNGAHLAAALYRLHQQGVPDVYSRVASAAASLTDVRELAVDVDLQRDLLTLHARVGNGPMLPARALSDGTLRFLALCIIGADAQFGGLVCMEEPENGIHPAKIEAMVDLVRDLAIDPSTEPSIDNPLRQVIVNTHSPYFVQYQHEDDLVLAEPTAVSWHSRISTTLRLLPLADSWRARRTPGMSKESIVEYLHSPPNTHLSLDVSTSA